jgi:hypothetical protein
MNAATKILIIGCCLFLCGVGALLSSKGNAKSVEPKSQIAPVINRQPASPHLPARVGCRPSL